MFLRIVRFFTCKVLWEKKTPENLGILESLLMLQYIEWYENLSVTSTLFSYENQIIYNICNSIFELKNLSLRDFGPLKVEYRRKINEDPQKFGGLHIRHYLSEKRRDTFQNYIFEHLISSRDIQRKNLNHTSHFKRSSDHSTSHRGNASFGFNPIPRVKEFGQSELDFLLDLSPQERKLQLLEWRSGNNLETEFLAIGVSVVVCLDLPQKGGKWIIR